jgi:molybdopterin/thiamine biosynthesis adenylyltransferase
LIVGMGGLGCPAAVVLASAGVGRLLLADDDEVDESNLHRQILYDADDVGRSKLEVAAKKLRVDYPGSSVEAFPSRALPDNVLDLVTQIDVVPEGADNYATKFLLADAARLGGRPVIHGAALGWRATVWAVCPSGAPCYRCLFEDIPSGAALNCSNAGVMGPVVGFAGALMAQRALDVLQQRDPYGVVTSYDGLTDRLRHSRVPARPDCPLCGPSPEIFRIEEPRYTRQSCAAQGPAVPGIAVPSPQTATTPITQRRYP